MKLYYATGTCSLAPRIVAHEAGIALDDERVDLGRHRTTNGGDYIRINPNGYVPALALDDGELLIEGAAIVQYLADFAPASGLAPAAGTRERDRLQQWLTFIATELHKMFNPWLFHPEYGAEPQEVVRRKITERFGRIEDHLADRDYLLGDCFSVADAYLFTIARWSRMFEIDLTPYPRLVNYLERIAARPAVADAMRAEGIGASA